MINNINILNSAYFSLILQLIIGIICVFGIFIPLKNKDNVLTDILILETIVQFIEFTFYFWLITQFSKINYEVTFVRYFDWFITTPTMLISIIIFMIYQNSLIETNNDPINFYKEFIENMNTIVYILLFNAFMLIFGFLGEIKLLNKNVSFIFGFIFFFLSYYLIFSNYVNNNINNLFLFIINFILWSLYGIAYLFTYKNKNISYNILDIFSKNLNGLFLFFYIIYLYYNE